MAQDVRELVRGTKIRDLLFAGAVDACKQMQDVWPVLGEEERDRMTNLIDAWAINAEAEIARRVGALFEAFVSSGQPSVAAAEKGFAIEGSTVTIKLAAPRAQVPPEFFTHKAQFLIVLTDGDVLSLEELNRQGDFFADDVGGPSPAAELAEQLRGESPIVAQFKASQAEAAEVALDLAEAVQAIEGLQAPTEGSPLELWRDEFLLALGQITAPEYAAKYDQGGELEGVAGVYQMISGWTPTAAALNESLSPDDRRIIADGPPPAADDDGKADAA